MLSNTRAPPIILETLHMIIPAEAKKVF